MDGDASTPIDAGSPVTVLSLCPTRVDALTAERLFSSSGVPARVYADAAGFRAALGDAEIGVILVAEEVLASRIGEEIRSLLAAQPDWSAIPLIVLTGPLSARNRLLLEDYDTYGRITLLERPIRLEALLSVTKLAIADRQQQYRVRDLLAERAEGIRRRDDFLAMLGHELRNPLGAISMYAEVLARSPDEGRVKECAARVQRQTRDMKRLLDDLLDVSRITRGQLNLQIAAVDLNELLRRVFDQVRHHVEERRQHVEVRSPNAAIRLQADGTRLCQVFANLLHNASRYSPPNTTIHLVVELGGDSVEVRVQDSGVGMTEDTLSHLFEPFYRAARGQGSGLGVGLTLASQLVELHGGSMQAASEGPGRGSELLVRLPLDPAAPSATATVESEATSDGQGRRVLVIDDNEDLAHAIKDLLEGCGYRVSLAHDGTEGLATARRAPPDVVLLDIGLPDMDGFEVARRLRQIPELGPLRVVAMSGYGDAKQRSGSESDAIDEYLVKPVPFDELQQAVAD